MHTCISREGKVRDLAPARVAVSMKAVLLGALITGSRDSRGLPGKHLS